MLYSGIDKHKDNCFIVTVNEQGKVVKEARVRNCAALLTEYFHSFPAEEEQRAVLESTAGWYWLDDLLTSLGIHLFLAHAKYLKAIAWAKVKTDRVDARTLAHLLRLGYIPEAHKVSREWRELRDLTRARLRLVQRRTACYNRIHHVAGNYNCDHILDVDKAVIPDELPALAREEVECQAAQIRLLNVQIDRLEQLVDVRLATNADLQRLFGAPAIGRITGVSVYLEIDGIERFGTEKQFFSYARVVPGAANSNRTMRHKSGSKEGNPYLRTAFSDAAVHAVRLYPEIRRFYQKHLRRRKKAIALTLVSKEMARIVYHILKDKTEYQGFKGQPIERRKRYPVRLHRSAGGSAVALSSPD